MKQAHAPIQSPAHNKTMMIVAAEDDCNYSWVSNSTAFGFKMLAKIGWNEGGGLVNSQQGMTTNLQAYSNSDNLGVGATTDLHSDLGESKTNENFGSVLKALGKEHQGGMTGTDGADGPPSDPSANAMAYSSNDVSDLDWARGGGGGVGEETRKE